MRKQHFLHILIIFVICFSCLLAITGCGGCNNACYDCGNCTTNSCLKSCNCATKSCATCVDALDADISAKAAEAPLWINERNMYPNFTFTIRGLASFLLPAYSVFACIGLLFMMLFLYAKTQQIGISFLRFLLLVGAMAAGVGIAVSAIRADADPGISEGADASEPWRNNLDERVCILRRFIRSNIGGEGLCKGVPPERAILS